MYTCRFCGKINDLVILLFGINAELNPPTVPTMPKLLRLGVPQGVGAHYYRFGIFLLDDVTGSRVTAFRKEYQGNAEDVVTRILQEWLEGRGLPVSWEKLIKTLRETGLNALADEIESSL